MSNEDGVIFKEADSVLSMLPAEYSPGIMLSQGLHGGEELNALLQSHSHLLLLQVQHALMLLVGLVCGPKTNPRIMFKANLKGRDLFPVPIS